MSGLRGPGAAGLASAAGLALAVALVAGCGGAPRSEPAAAPPERSAPVRSDDDGPLRNEGGPKVETVATGLEIPWDIAFLPDGRALITERPGRLRLLSRAGKLRSKPLAEIPVSAVGEGGLLGVAVDPEFKDNDYVYLYRTTRTGNVVTRYRLRDGSLREQATIIKGLESSAIHNGGRIEFGPDERLYVSIGDAAKPQLAQDPRALNGKLLRMAPRAYRGSGGRPEVYSLGHRNPQGFDWQPDSERLFEDEHGPTGNDEVNLIRKGANYGWPDIRGSAERSGFVSPIVLYEEGIAPSGATFVTQPGSSWTGDYLIAALRGQQLRRVALDGERITANEPLFEERFGRLRTVTEAPDGTLYVLTSNRDGRGNPDASDDRVLRVIPPAG